MNKEIVKEMEQRFKKEFVITARNKIDLNNSMELTFSYYNYLLNEKKNYSALEIFNIFDNDKTR